MCGSLQTVARSTQDTKVPSFDTRITVSSNLQAAEYRRSYRFEPRGLFWLKRDKSGIARFGANVTQERADLASEPAQYEPKHEP
ncbi:hypothetical protein K239x_44780 [Planctomycetes bacterium K23_9]|uniref:Uncharacterized protein n=1 Tax=Stieleria marina TaxID=1930275 RepID=A0A517NZD0_9BACT|nr:hypothetical protein K239x_44780 [Planctomycetes bacterium K23_9]